MGIVVSHLTLEHTVGQEDERIYYHDGEQRVPVMRRDPSSDQTTSSKNTTMPSLAYQGPRALGLRAGIFRKLGVPQERSNSR